MAVHGSATWSIGIVGATVTLALAVAACSAGPISPATPTAGDAKPERVFAAPANLMAAAQPQPNGTLWALAGDAASKRLFDINLATGSGIGSISVSNAARSVTESLSGVVGLALGSGATGALELLNGDTGKVIATISLDAPARDVIVGSNGATFYVLTGTPRSANVTVVNSGDGNEQGTIPVPRDTVSIAPDASGVSVYALEPDGTISQIAVAGGKVMSTFAVGSRARSVALSPDGSTLYVLKDAGSAANVAVVNVATQSVRQVLPAPANCLQVLVSADGSQLYQLVGTPSYGDIQVFPS
jgi:DNA-binding beta-propeller fold protein YncE